MDSLYVCLFSNGHIKVGRSIDPLSRIASHADRVACMGVELREHHIAECDGPSAVRESDLIRRCAEVAMARFHNEWFVGLDFTTVCGWADECSTYENPEFAGHSDWSLVVALGGSSRVADLIGWPRSGGAQRVQNWRRRGIPASVKLAFPDLFLREEAESGVEGGDPVVHAANSLACD